MSEKKPHFAVDFASRYSLDSSAYLSAWTAIIRAEELIEDAEQLKKNLEEAVSEEDRWVPWIGAEVVSYYAVGFVTCLEWHARSRLVDLLTFQPAAARADDLKIVRDRVVLDMISANVTVASVVGAATNVSSLDDYMGIFKRFYDQYKPGTNGFDVLKMINPRTAKCFVANDEIDDLKRLYTFRHDLVHEIGMFRVGHHVMRDRWDLDDSIVAGKLVLRLMQAIEASVTASAPDGFPNVLGEDGYPKSERIRIESEIANLETRLENILAGFEEMIEQPDHQWKKAVKAYKTYSTIENEFIDNFELFFNRYVEMREPVRMAVARGRKHHLTEMIRVLGETWLIEESDQVGAKGK